MAAVAAGMEGCRDTLTASAGLSKMLLVSTRVGRDRGALKRSAVLAAASARPSSPTGSSAKPG